MEQGLTILVAYLCHGYIRVSSQVLHQLFVVAVLDILKALQLCILDLLLQETVLLNLFKLDICVVILQCIGVNLDIKLIVLANSQIVNRLRNHTILPCAIHLIHGV